MLFRLPGAAFKFCLARLSTVSGVMGCDCHPRIEAVAAHR